MSPRPAFFAVRKLLPYVALTFSALFANVRPVTAAETQSPTPSASHAVPLELRVNGRRLETMEGKDVWLQGVNVVSLEFRLHGEHVEDAIRNRQVQLVFNTTDSAKAISDSKSLRRATLMQKVPYYTTMAGAEAAAQAIKALRAGNLEVRPLQSYFA